MLTLKHLSNRQETVGILSEDGGAGRCHFCIHLLPSWCWSWWAPFITPAFWPVSFSGSVPSPHTTAIAVDCLALMHNSWAVKYLTFDLGHGVSCPSYHVLQPQPASLQMVGMHSPLSIWLECLALVASEDCVSVLFGSKIIKKTVRGRLPSLE